MRLPIGLGDALRVLRSDPHDIPAEKHVRALEMLGLRLPPSERPQDPAASRLEPDDSTPTSRTETPHPETEIAIPAHEVVDDRNDALVTRSITRPHEGNPLLAGVEPLPRESPDADDGEPPIEPLFNPAWQRAILVAALRSVIAGDELDVDRVVERITRIEPIEQIPRLSRRSLQAVQLVVDRCDSMKPFFEDQSQLVGAIAKLLPAEHLDVVWCDAAPMLAAEDDLDPYRLPRPGTTVLILSNFGLVTKRDFVMRHHVEGWVAFAKRLRLYGCPAIAFVPMIPDQVPFELRRALSVIEWDRHVGAARVMRGRAAAQRSA